MKKNPLNMLHVQFKLKLILDRKCIRNAYNLERRGELTALGENWNHWRGGASPTPPS